MKTKDIGATVKAIRVGMGMTQRALAGGIGVSQAMMTRLENGLQGFRSQTVVNLAKALKVPPFRLFMTDEEWAKWQKAK